MVDETTHDEAIGALRWLPWLVGIGVLIWLVAMYGRPEEWRQVSAPAPAAVPVQSDRAVIPERAPLPAAKIYFLTGKTDTPNEAPQTLKAVTDYLKTNPASKAVVSGFYDPKGNKAWNEELAKNRARSVSEALKAAGIGADRVLMPKLQESAGAANDTETRRVDVTIEE
jgi:outer membrane protein OmpA-like peptidoglycan-associated protein